MLRTCGECGECTALRGGAPDGRLGDGQIDRPAGALCQIGGEHASAEDRAADTSGGDLGAGGHADRVRPDHPRAVGGDVAASYGGEAEHEAGGHRGREDEAEHVEQVAGAGLRLVKQRLPAVSGIALSATRATGTGQLRSRVLIG